MNGWHMGYEDCICCIYLLYAGIVAYVEVRSGGDNRSMGIKSHLRSLGATVRDKFTDDVSCEYCSFF
jgi:hypothetical protein